MAGDAGLDVAAAQEGGYFDFVTSSRTLFSFGGDAPFKGRISIELSLVP